MIYRLRIQDWMVIGHYLGALVLIVAGAMVPMFFLALALGESSAAVHFLLSIGITGTVGGLLMLLGIKKQKLDWRQALIVTGLCWVILSIFGALPLYLSGHYGGFLDAYFETVSCFTTTGISVTLDQDHMALSVVAWRAIMNVLGGVGVVIVALALGIFGSGSAVASLYHDEARGEAVMPQIRQSAMFILRVTLTIILVGTIACCIPLALLGMDPSRVLLHAFFVTTSDFTTGGMIAQSNGIMYYHSWPLEVITMVIMVFSGVNFMLYGSIWRGQTKFLLKDIEVRTIAIWVTLLALLMAISTVGSVYSDPSAMLRRGLYELISACFNAGYSTMYPGQMLYGAGSGALFVVILGMAVGASASSISGGIKALRVGVIVRSFVQTIRAALSPQKARPRTFFWHQGKQLLTPEITSSALTVTLLYILTDGIGSIAGILYGYDAMQAIFESVSAASNTGLSMGITNGSMPSGLEVMYILEMWLGRLEFIAIFTMIVQISATVTGKIQDYRRKKGKEDRRSRMGEIKKRAAQGKGQAEEESLSATRRKDRSGRKNAVTSLVVVLALAMGVAGVPATAAWAVGQNAQGGISQNIFENRYSAFDGLSSKESRSGSDAIAVSVSGLTSMNLALDGRKVTITGEAIGDVLDAGNGYKWVNINDGTGASIGVYMTSDMASHIANLGSYKMTGTTLQIEGTYEANCPDHQGELDIHASTVFAVDSGGPITYLVNQNMFLAGVALTITSLVILLLFVLLRRRWVKGIMGEDED